MELFNASTLIDVIGELFSDETSIVLSDTKEYLYYQPSKRIDLKIKPGDPILEGTITYKALLAGQKVSEYIDRDVFGVPYYGMAVPYSKEGEIRGCVTAVFPTLTNAMSVITIKKSDGWVPVPFTDVIYIEAKERKTFVITKENVGTHTNTLNEFDFLLPRDSFIRCHRSYIVNVNYIKEIYPDTRSTFILKMIDDTLVPVSQTHASYFRKLLGF
ncbi:LytTR family DNA-binding domain-containing protein [Pseudalkalibacillus caeni]|uniref:LytTR family transcriptional regulator n=1 Tax=Exobacillus caeni TaxID=2574798 RepID=A0A5R9F4H6_9BACL|nr:LytTR family DNA-binding domain-containing protein [Pseudalkalibacillus caeni]TLS35394.1 LytTR family transcriptional regulator [Pseudalkalibacillus caeni]